MTASSYSRSSRQRLTQYDLARFPSDSLFDRLARAVCRAGCLPRKELFEAWEVARRTRRLFRGGRVVDLAAGHGLLAHVMLLLDDSSTNALAVDPAVTPSRQKLHDVILDSWPRLHDRVTYVPSAIESVTLGPEDVIVSSHACGRLSDLVIDRAVRASARVAVLPCCHDLAASDSGGLTGWIDGPLAVDLMRARRMQELGYRIWTQSIPPAITPKNRLLLGAPASVV